MRKPDTTIVSEAGIELRWRDGATIVIDEDGIYCVFADKSSLMVESDRDKTSAHWSEIYSKLVEATKS